MKLFAAIRHAARRETPHPPPPIPTDRAQLDAAVRRQEHYNFLHYDGVAQPPILPYDAAHQADQI